MRHGRFSPSLLAWLCAAALATGCGDENEDTDSTDAGDDASVSADASDSQDAGETGQDAGASEQDANTDAGAGEDASEGQDASGENTLTDDGELDGRDGASGTVNGMTYTFTENVSWFYAKGNLAAYQALVRNWEIYGIPRAVGTYPCNTDGVLPRVRLILGNQYYTSSDGGSCTIEVVSVSETHVEGRFSAELRGAFPPNDAFGAVTNGVFRKRN